MVAIKPPPVLAMIALHNSAIGLVKKQAIGMKKGAVSALGEKV
ncbi:hypothetical protein YERSI8AC_300106 [Enterobacterales bacterium 8AC]|nr:hypothetical protein YERSI8AC_300106 [Enterobacterales bacterium 8AC]